MNHKNELKAVLQNVFGHENYLNEWQKKAVETIWEAKRDVFVRGFGKSLCYQLPVLIKDNSFIIVISPSTAYIKHHTKYLTSKQIATHYLTSDTSRKKRKCIEDDITSTNSTMKILFITPLQYESGYFKTILKRIQNKRLCYIVIDAADNILSQHSRLQTQFKNLDLKIIRVPIVTISSTATQEKQSDIIKGFGLLNPLIFSMPVLRTNLYHDVWFTNQLPDPISHLKKFIENCLHLDSSTISEVYEQECWGVIFCKNLEATENITKFLNCTGISSLPYVSKKMLSHKNENIKKLKNVKVIVVCEEVDILTITNSLVNIIARKLIRFIVYWHVLPSIKKYYLESSRARCFYDMTYCRVYFQLEEPVNNKSQFYENNCDSESATVITQSLIKMQCRHKVYCDFFGDTFSACGEWCDFCKEKEQVKERTILLVPYIHDNDLSNLEDKSPEFSQSSYQACDQKLQCKSSKQKSSRTCQIKNHTHYKTKFDGTTIEKKFNYPEVILEKNDSKADEQSKAASTLNEIYKNLFQMQKEQPIQTFTFFPTQSIALTTANERKNIDNNEVIDIENVYKRKRLLTNDNKLLVTKNSGCRDDIHHLRKSIRRSGSSDEDVMRIDESYLSKKESHRVVKISENNRKRKRSIEIITIEEQVCERKKPMENETDNLKISLSNSDSDDDVIFVDEITSFDKKR